MNKEEITNFMDVLSEKVQTIGAKVSNQRHLSSIRDAFASFIPFIIVGSFAILINSVFIAPDSLFAIICGAGTDPGENAQLYASWSKVSTYISPLFDGIIGATMNFFAIYIAILLGYFLAGTYDDNKMFGGLISLACFLALQPTNALDNPLAFFNSTGVLFAMFAGLMGPTIFHHLSTSERLKVKMPDGVPPAIAKSFDALFPIMFTIIIFASFQPIWGAFAYGVGFGASTIDHSFFTLSGTVNYTLGEGGKDASKTGTIIVEQGTGLYTLMNLTSLLKGMEISEIPNLGGLISNNEKIIPFLDNWFTGQVTSIIGKDGLWFDVNIDYEATFKGADEIGPSFGTSYTLEPIKIINQDWYYLVNTINSLIVLPLQNAGDTAWFVFIVYGLYTFIFFFGIHGGNALSPIIATIFVTAILHNVDVLAQAGSVSEAINNPIYYDQLRIFSDQTAGAFLEVGGAGATVGLMAALWVFSKSPSSREVNKVGTPPLVFNINEPYIFGLPIMLNPIYALPFIFLQPCLGVVVYFITAAGWMNPTMFYLPWTVPFGISGLVSTADYRSIFVSLAIFVTSFLVYTPFVFMDARAQVKMQLADGENEEYNNLVVEMQEIRKRLLINSTNKELISQKNNLKLKIKIIEDEVAQVDLFNIKAYTEGKYFPVGRELVKEKYALIYENLLDKETNKKEIKDQLKVFDKKIKILGVEAKLDTAIVESEISLSNKIASLEDRRDENVSRLEEKIEETEEHAIIKNNKIEAKSNIKIEKIENEIALLKEQTDYNKKITLLENEIIEINKNSKNYKFINQNKKETKLLKLAEKIKSNKFETSELISKTKTDQQGFADKKQKKLLIVKAKREEQFKK